MGKFTWDDLNLFIERGQMAVAEARILVAVEEEEPELMAYWVYKKRIRIAPDDVTIKAWDRWKVLVREAGVTLPGDYKVIRDNVMNTIWNRLSDEERQGWLRSI